MKVLQMCYALDGGGVERILFDYYSHMNHEKLQFDFVKVEAKEGILEAPLRAMGCKIYRIPPLKNNYKKYSDILRSILSKGNYDAIHCNGAYRSALALKLAKEAGVPIRIAHSHTAFEPEDLGQRTVRKLLTPFAKYYATDLFACGKDAAEWMWGKRAVESGNVRIIHNAVITDNFKFDMNKRAAARRELDIEKRFVIGHIGRLSYQKNHELLLDIFCEIYKIRPDAVLLLIGRGEAEADIRAKAKALGIYDNILFLGVRKDVPELLNAMDLFLFPSRWEGLPVTLIEVQANGLPAIISETVTKEAVICDGIQRLSLEKSVWVKNIVCKEFKRYEDGIQKVREAGYDIKKASRILENYYLSYEAGFLKKND